MIDTNRCPECESLHTERVQVDIFTDYVEELRICNECPTQYAVEYGNPMINDVKVFDE